MSEFTVINLKKKACKPFNLEFQLKSDGGEDFLCFISAFFFNVSFQVRHALICRQSGTKKTLCGFKKSFIVHHAPLGTQSVLLIRTPVRTHYPPEVIPSPHQGSAKRPTRQQSPLGLDAGTNGAILWSCLCHTGYGELIPGDALISGGPVIISSMKPEVKLQSGARWEGGGGTRCHLQESFGQSSLT